MGDRQTGRLIEDWTMVVEGTRGGIANCKIMIDTAAVPSAINGKLAGQLGFHGSFQKRLLTSQSTDA